MIFPKLNSPSLKELFTQELESMILSDQLPVGTQLPSERELSSSMSVSRAVVNAGITELARKGFLIIKPRIGTFVADYRREGNLETLMSIINYNGGTLRDAEVRSILELKIAFDTQALQLAIPKITSDELSILKVIIDDMKMASSSEVLSELSHHFYHELAIISGNTIIPLIVTSFKPPVVFLWKRFCFLYGNQALIHNTECLYEYIEKKDINGAIHWSTECVNSTIYGDKKIYC